MKTAQFAIAISLAAGFASVDASAFCIYNDTNSNSYSHSIDYAVNGTFEAKLKPGKNSCCNYREKSCNPTGKQDALLDHEMKVVNPGPDHGYITPPSTIGRGDHIECAPPRKQSGITDSTKFYTAKVQGGGYVKFVNNPRFDKLHWLSPDNPPYIANSYSHDHKLLGSYTCPNKDNWGDKTRGPHGKKVTLVSDSSSPTDGVLIKGYGGKCFDARMSANHGPAQSGAVVTLWTCHGAHNQRWDVKSDHIRLAGTNLCLDAASTSDGMPFKVFTCALTGGGQYWALKDGVLLDPRKSKYCADAKRESTDNGTPIIRWACHGGANQKWRAVKEFN